MTTSAPVFSFRDTWVVAAEVASVRSMLIDLGRYPVWWPQIRAVARLGPDDAWVRCRSALPYTLDLVLHAERREEALLETSISGDLEGSVRWRLTPHARGTSMEFEQDVVLAHPWLARTARPAERLLRWNHEWMMRGCREGLVRSLVA